MTVDMSPAAVTARLRQVSELRRLCLSLSKAKPVDSGAVTDAKNPSPEKSADARCYEGAALDSPQAPNI
jgi:hypothetical protein